MAAPRSQIVIVAVAVAVAMVGTYLYTRSQGAFDGDDASDPERMVQATRIANPHLLIEEAPGRGRPYVFVKEIATGRQVLFPWSELPNAKIRFVDCDPARIPAGLFYPNRTALACVELRNDRHAMSSYYFDTRDGLARTLDFFELNLPAGQRRQLGSGRAPPSVESVRRDPETRAFVVSYLLLEGAGFIGYAEEKAPSISK